MICIKRLSLSLNNQLRHLSTNHKLCHELKTENEYKSVKNEKLLKNNKQDKRLHDYNPISKSSQSPQHYCMECVKKYDYENYLSTLLLKESSLIRSALAIRAFNSELSQIRDLTSTQLLAQMRLQFWSDLIDEIYGTNEPIISAQRQPIAYEIQICKSKAKLSKHWFKKLIETRMNAINLSDFPFQTSQELEQYCDSTVSPVYYLIIESAFGLSENNKLLSNQRIVFDHIASHVGRAQGIANTLRGVSHNAKYNRCYIPSELLIKYKTSHEDFLRVKQIQNVKDVCFEMASIANQHIETAFSLIKQIERQKRLIFLPAVVINSYLNRLQKCDFNIFDPKLGLRQGFLPITLWYKSKFL